MDKNNKDVIERRLENLIFLHKEKQDKYVYYLLAIAAACIAFTVNLTKDDKINYNQIPLILAILFWVLSFYYGIKQLQNSEVAIQLNIIDLNHHLNGEENSKFNLGQIEEKSRKGLKYRKYQNWCIFLGAISFMIWHILRILSNC